MLVTPVRVQHSPKEERRVLVASPSPHDPTSHSHPFHRYQLARNGGMAHSEQQAQQQTQSRTAKQHRHHAPHTHQHGNPLHSLSHGSGSSAHLRPPAANHRSRSGSFGSAAAAVSVSSAGAASRSPSAGRRSQARRRRSIGSGAQQWRAVVVVPGETSADGEAAASATRVEMRRPPRSAMCAEQSRQHFFSPVTAAPPSLHYGHRRHSIHALEHMYDEDLVSTRASLIQSPTAPVRRLHDVDEAEPELGGSLLEPPVALYGPGLLPYRRRGISPSQLLAAASGGMVTGNDSIGGSVGISATQEPRLIVAIPAPAPATTYASLAPPTTIRPTEGSAHGSSLVTQRRATRSMVLAPDTVKNTSSRHSAVIAAPPAHLPRVMPNPTAIERRAPWFATDMALQRALVKLPAYDGAFVVVAPPGDRQYLVLAVRHADDVWHTNVRCVGGPQSWHLEDDTAAFASLTALLQHYAAVRGPPSVAPPCLLMFDAPSAPPQTAHTSSKTCRVRPEPTLPVERGVKKLRAELRQVQDDALRRRAYSASEAIYVHMEPPQGSAEDATYEHLLLTQSQRQRLETLAAALDRRDAMTAAGQVREGRSASLGSAPAEQEVMDARSAAAMAVVAAADAALMSAAVKQAAARDSGIGRDHSVTSSGSSDWDEVDPSPASTDGRDKRDRATSDGAASSPCSPVPSPPLLPLRRTQSTGSRASLEEEARRATRGEAAPAADKSSSPSAAVKDVKSVSSVEVPAIIVDEGMRQQSWYRLEMPTSEALSALADQRDGAFIVRSSRAHYASLSYIHGSHLRSVHILCRPQGGFHLKHSTEVFPTLGALVRQIVEEGHETLLCPLHPPESPA